MQPTMEGYSKDRNNINRDDVDGDTGYCRIRTVRGCAVWIVGFLVPLIPLQWQCQEFHISYAPDIFSPHILISIFDKETQQKTLRFQIIEIAFGY